MSLEALVKMSNRFGEEEEFVLAGGGNTSFKEKEKLYVKGYRAQLSDITAEQFVVMDIEKLLEMSKREYPADMNNDEREKVALSDMMAARLPGEENKRPSVESILHAMFPYKFVLHVHPALINGLTCSVDGKDACTKILGDDVVWIELTKPGLVLSQACNKVFAEYTKNTGKCPQIVILQNHGIFTAADSVDEIDQLMMSVVKKLKGYVRDNDVPNFEVIAFKYDMDLLHEMSAKIKSLYSDLSAADPVALFRTDKTVSQFVSDAMSFAPVSKPFTPDHIVNCKDEPLFIEPDADIEADIEAYTAKKGFKPRIVAVCGVGFFALGTDKKNAERAQALFVDAIKIASYARSFGGVNPLDDEFANFILNWEVEAYRAKA